MKGDPKFSCVWWEMESEERVGGTNHRSTNAKMFGRRADYSYKQKPEDNMAAQVKYQKNQLCQTISRVSVRLHKIFFP